MEVGLQRQQNSAKRRNRQFRSLAAAAESDGTNHRVQSLLTRYLTISTNPTCGNNNSLMAATQNVGVSVVAGLS